MTAHTSTIINRKIFEPESNEELLKAWLLHAHKGRERHDRAARLCDKKRRLLGGSAAVIAAIVGTSIFAVLEKDSLGNKISNSSVFITVAVATLSVLSAILTSLSVFLNLAEQTEKHRAAGVRYKEVIRELEQILSTTIDKLPNINTSIEGIREKLDKLEESAPVVPEGIFDQIEQKWRKESINFVQKAEDLYSEKKRDSLAEL